MTTDTKARLLAGGMSLLTLAPLLSSAFVCVNATEPLWQTIGVVGAGVSLLGMATFFATALIGPDEDDLIEVHGEIVGYWEPGAPYGQDGDPEDWWKRGKSPYANGDDEE